MASSPSNSVSEPAIIEQVITEFFAKSLHIILESRSPYVSSRNYSAELFTPSPSSSSSSGRPRDKWFNLALRDCSAALENFDPWRQSNLEPLFVDVILVRRRSKELPLSSWSSGHDEFLSDNKREKIVERWVVQYESRKSNDIPRVLHLSAKRSGSGSSHSSEIPSAYKKIYKRTIVFLRSLYAMVRLLPAYKVFRDLNSSGRICAFSLSHKISSFVEPFTRAEDSEMNQFSFVPVDTPCGRLSLSVSYLPILEDVNYEPSTPISPQFIPDYVGSPTTDPLKRLQSLPSAGSLPTYISYSRRHSWSNDRGVAPSFSPSPSPSPSPSSTYSDSHAWHYTPRPHLPPQSHPSDHHSSTCPTSHNLWSSINKRNTGFDEYWPSPPFSPSSSPSPPTHMRGSLLRSESAPVSIPLLRLRVNIVSHGLPPSPSSKSVKDLRAQVTAASASQTSSPNSKLLPKKSSGELLTGMTMQKILYSGKDEAGNLSPGILDEFDDSDFTCPFAVDDVILDSCRPPAAMAGALVQMLKTAAPLRQQDHPNSVTSLRIIKGESLNKEKEVGAEKLDAASGSSVITTSGLLKVRTAADALEELKSYKEMKELLLKQSESQPLDVDRAENLASEGLSEF